jgi:hypothetical protein
MQHARPKRYSYKSIALILSTVMTFAIVPVVNDYIQAQSATYASGALEFNPKGVGCSDTSAEGGYLSLSPGVGPTDGSSFTIQAVIRSVNIGVDKAVVLLGAQGDPIVSPTFYPDAGLTVYSRSSTEWVVDSSGTGSLRFQMSGQVLRNGVMTDFVMRNNTWHQLTIIGDTTGVSVYVDGDRLVSINPETYSNAVITTNDEVGASHYKRATDVVERYKFSNSLASKSTMIGAWK